MSEYRFPTAYKGGRPVRLSEATRRFAMESLQGKYGTQTLATPFVSVDGIVGWDGMSEHQKYAAALDLLVRECPIRICPAELVCGAATLGAVCTWRSGILAECQPSDRGFRHSGARGNSGHARAHAKR